MANPTIMTGGLPGVFTCTDAVAYCTVDPDRIYTFKHDGENAAGAASTDIIYLAFNGTAPDPDGSEGANKAKLCSGDVVAIGPGLTSFGFDMAAAETATMTVIPSVRVDVGAGATPDGIRATTSGTEELTAEFSELTGATAVHLAAGPARALLTGGLTVDGVPAITAAGALAAAWLDLYRRQVLYGANLGEGTLDVSVRSTPGKPVPLIEAGWAALADPGNTPVIDIRDWANFTVQWTVATIDTSVDLIIWVSIDNEVSFFPLVPTITVLANGTDFLEVDAFACTHMYCEFDAEVGGNAAAVTFKAMAAD